METSPNNNSSPSLVEYTLTTPIPPWNFNRADWGCFKTESATLCDHLTSTDTDINTCYSVFQRKLLEIAKRTISRGFRNPYIPGWDPTCEVLENDLEKAQSIPDKRLQINCWHISTPNVKRHGKRQLKTLT